MRRLLLLAIVMVTTSITGVAMAQPAISSEIAPFGKLRVAMNAQTAVSLTRTSDGKITGGVALDVGKFIAEKLGVPFELVPYPNADTYSQSFGKGAWDIAFGTRTPLVANKADFIIDVVLTDYVFVAAPGREFADAAQVDRPGVKVGAAQASASDQFLSQTLKSAELLRIPSGSSTGSSAIEVLRTGKADVWATSAGNVQQIIDSLPGAKLVPGAFKSDQYMVILPKGKSSAAQSKIVEIVNEAKRTGLVRKAIDQTGIKGVRAAP